MLLPTVVFLGAFVTFFRRQLLPEAMFFGRVLDVHSVQWPWTRTERDARPEKKRGGKRERDGASMAFSGERLRPAMLRRAVSVHVRSCLHFSYCLNAIFIVPCLLYPPCIKEKVRVWTHDGCRRRLPPPADQLPSCGPFLVIWHVK